MRGVLIDRVTGTGPGPGAVRASPGAGGAVRRPAAAPAAERRRACGAGPGRQRMRRAAAAASRIAVRDAPSRRGRRRVRRAAAAAAPGLLLLLIACGPAQAPADVAGPAAGAAAPRPTAAADPAAADHRARVVILGDSLTAGLGLDPADAWPARLQARVDAEGWPIDVVPMGVSGETTAGGLRRLDWALDGAVDLLVVALGGNDGLRGLPVAQMRENLAAIIDGALARGIEVVLAGMEAPPNFGAAYTTAFRAAFRALAESRPVTFVPFLLEGVAGAPALNQADGIHPNAAGADRVAGHLWPALAPRFAEIAAGRDAAP